MPRFVVTQRFDVPRAILFDVLCRPGNILAASPPDLGLELLEARAGLIFTELERAMGGSFKKLKAIREANSAAEQALVMQNGIV